MAEAAGRWPARGDCGLEGSHGDTRVNGYRDRIADLGVEDEQGMGAVGGGDDVLELSGLQVVCAHQATDLLLTVDGAALCCPLEELELQPRRVACAISNPHPMTARARRYNFGA